MVLTATVPGQNGMDISAAQGHPPLATNSLERALMVLQILGRKRAGFTNAELSRELHMPKSTCTYILCRLERDSYVTRDHDTGRYQIGLTMLNLAHHALHAVPFLASAEGILCGLVEQTGLSASLGILQQKR